MSEPASPEGGADRSAYRVVGAEHVYRGRIFGLRRDTVAMPDGQVAVREVVDHPGAVVVVALDDDQQVVLIRQYRPAVRDYLWELPAGLLDVDGEPPATGAARELAEEAGLVAATWHVLLDLRSSPGYSDEAVRVYLARGLTDVPASDRHVGEHEEADLTVRRVPLAEAVRWALAGRIENAAAVAGVLAAAVAAERDFAGVRAVDAPWPARPDPTAVVAERPE